MYIPMTDLTLQYQTIKNEIDEAIQRTVSSGKFILGPEVEAFEEEMSAYCGVKYGIGVASGTDALIISLAACGIRPGDEVITSPFTFIATAEAIIHCGAVPVFVDIDPRTYNIDTKQIESKINNKTRAIIPVHLFGQPAEMDAIMYLKNKYDIKLVEDCAQALSAQYRGKKVGSIGDAGCLSFFPSKNLGAFGDGGMIVTNDVKIADVARMLRNHGQRSSYYHSLPGFNSRLDAIQAAILRVKLKYLDNWSFLRRQKASLYTQLLGKINGIEPPNHPSNDIVSANYYTVRLNRQMIDRNALRKYLAAKNIDTSVYYPISLHLQEAFKNLGYNHGDFPQSELAQEEVLSLPIFPELSDHQAVSVINHIREYLEKQ
jgi:dTDP-4-amino-4,6-dideoxygalactose transaminase